MCAAISSTARCGRALQAWLDLVLYVVFFIPGIAALIYAGYYYAADSWRIAEHSNVTAEGPPVYHFKSVIPIAGALVMLQGIAEIVRCIVCLKTGEWPSRLKDVAEIDVVEEQLAHSQYVDEESRKIAIERAHADRRGRAPARHGRGLQQMSDPALGLLMLVAHRGRDHDGLPDGLHADGPRHVLRLHRLLRSLAAWTDNRVFDLMVQRTYGAMTNDVLISIPLFVLMGYVMERGALVDKMFYSIQLAFRRVPASLAVATLIVCTFWGIASGLVGAVVVLMGVIAFNPMLRAGYDVKLASGVITAGGTLGILIPPSVMIIVYAAVAGQSVVKLYAAAMFPGFFLAFLYLIYIIGWAMMNPKIAPPLPEEQTRVPVPAWMRNSSRSIRTTCSSGSCRRCSRHPRRRRSRRTRDASPIGCCSRTWPPRWCRSPWLPARSGCVWWYVVIHQQVGRRGRRIGRAATGHARAWHPKAATPAEQGPAQAFYLWFGGIAALCALLMMRYYARLDADRLEVIKLLTSSVMPLGILTVVVLGVILFGITTATESAGVGAAGAFLLALQARTLDWKRTKEAVFLTAKTTAMVCWLFVGSALFSGVFAILGGQALVEQWVLSLNMSPLQFMILSQASSSCSAGRWSGPRSS